MFQPRQSSWNCSFCGLSNNHMRPACQACHYDRHHKHTQLSYEESGYSADNGYSAYSPPPIIKKKDQSSTVQPNEIRIEEADNKETRSYISVLKDLLFASFAEVILSATGIMACNKLIHCVDSIKSDFNEVYQLSDLEISDVWTPKEKPSKQHQLHISIVISFTEDIQIYHTHQIYHVHEIEFDEVNEEKCLN